MTAFILVPLLIYLSAEDIRKRKIYLPIPLIGTAFIIVMHYVCGKPVWFFMLSAFVFFGVFLLVSRVTHGQIGSGDAFVLGMTGAAFGFLNNLRMLYFSFLFAFFYSLISMAVLKKGRQYIMPFVPFVLLGAVVVFLGNI